MLVVSPPDGTDGSAYREISTDNSRISTIRICSLDLSERDSERATFVGVEHMHVAGRARRQLPRRDRARIEERTIDSRAGRVHAAAYTGRAHVRTLACAARATRRPGGRR